MARALVGVAITLFVSMTCVGCLVNREDLLAPPERDASVDAHEVEDDTGLVCGVDERVCASRCTDTMADPMHCGDCGVACVPGQTCTDGSCEGCSAPTAYGVCGVSLRLWLDARNPAGDGSAGTIGPLARWVNLARTSTGDAVPSLGAPTLEEGAGGRRVVRFAGSALDTMGVLSESGDHAEIFLVARSTSLATGVALTTHADMAQGVMVQLPGESGYVFALPGVEPATPMTAPFGRDTRHTTLWHAFGGPTGREVRIDGTVVVRGEGGVAAPLASRLLIGASEDGRAQSIDVSELLVFDRPLSAGDRATITAALLDRWGLGSPATPSTDDLSLWLDARMPLRDEDVVDGATLARWDDRSPRAVTATAVAATYRADGFGGGRPAIELMRDAGASNVSFPRPVSGDMTLLVAFATDDGAGEGEAWSSPNLIGADARRDPDDGAVVLVSGHVGFGREATSTPTSRRRLDDGDLHVLAVRRSSADGRLEMWVDHEVIVSGDTRPGPITSPATWFLGRHPDDGEGALAVRYGEVLAYARALDDEALTTAERYLVRRWSSAPAARQPRLTGCIAGTHLDCPVGSLSDLRLVPTGRYWIDLGAGPHHVWIDGSEGGGWALVLQYVHAPDASPELDVVQPGEDWPTTSPTTLGGGDGVRSPRWGHVGMAVASRITSATEMRFQGTTSAHPRVIHFSTTVGLTAWRSGANGFSGIATSFTPLTGHSGRLPASALVFPAPASPDTVLTDFPFFGSTADWCVRGSGLRWEVDDLPVNDDNATIHRVWVR
ncbi:MAG: hypothetical protein J0L92_04545 [Deltaproteobacteria bacterium]|nr:hypothetical protein [Deltaproteobacteria bacterium]